MNSLGRDAAWLLLGALLALTIQDSFPKTKEERRAERHAIEVKYEACAANCMKGCVK